MGRFEVIWTIRLISIISFLKGINMQKEENILVLTIRNCRMEFSVVSELMKDFKKIYGVILDFSDMKTMKFKFIQCNANESSNQKIKDLKLKIMILVSVVIKKLSMNTMKKIIL